MQHALAAPKMLHMRKIRYYQAAGKPIIREDRSMDHEPNSRTADNVGLAAVTAKIRASHAAKNRQQTGPEFCGIGRLLRVQKARASYLQKDVRYQKDPHLFSEREPLCFFTYLLIALLAGSTLLERRYRLLRSICTHPHAAERSFVTGRSQV